MHRTAPDAVDGEIKSITTEEINNAQLGKLIIRAAKSPDRSVSPDYVRKSATVIESNTTSQQRQTRQGAYVNVQGSDEGKTATIGLNRAICINKDRINGKSIVDNNYNKNNNKTTVVGTATTCNNNIMNNHSRIVRCIDSRVLDKNNVINVNDAENKPPPLPIKTTPRRLHSMNLRFRHNKPNSLERKILKSNPRLLNNCSNTSKLELLPQSLKSSGDTPKLTRRSSKSFVLNNTIVKSSVNGNNSIVNYNNKNDGGNKEEKKIDSIDNKNLLTIENGITETPRIERKLKRSESYRMANSPIMFIKKLSNSSTMSTSSSFNNSDKKIFRTASEELRDDLLKESINYPDSVASPELVTTTTTPTTTCFDSDDNLSSENFNCTTYKIPNTPRPRATDLEPARVLKYLGTSTEIW